MSCLNESISTFDIILLQPASYLKADKMIEIMENVHKREISCQFFLFILCLNSMRCISSCYNPFYLCMWTWYLNKCKIDWVIRTNSTFTCHLHNTMHSSSQLLYRCTESWMSSPKVMIVSCMQDIYIYSLLWTVYLKKNNWQTKVNSHDAWQNLCMF